MDDDTIGNSLYDFLGDSKIVFNESGDLFVRIPWFGGYRDYYTTAAGTKEDWLSRQQANADGIATVQFSSDRDGASLPQTDIDYSTGLDATVVPAQTSNKEKLTGVKLIDTFGINVNNDLAYLGSVQGIGSSRIEPQYLLDPLNAAFTDREYFTEEELRDGVYYDEDTGMYTTYSGVPLHGEPEKFKTRERVKEQVKEKLEESSNADNTLFEFNIGGYGFRIVDDREEQKVRLATKVQEWAHGMEFLGSGYSAGGLVPPVKTIATKMLTVTERVTQGSSKPVRDVIMESVSNPKLKNAVDQIYRPGAKVGDGGLADAIRHELTAGELVGGKSHIQKGFERVKNLENILAKENLSQTEREITQKMLSDLKDALKGVTP